MANFLRLPSGKFFNVDTIIDTEKGVRIEGDEPLFAVFVNEPGPYLGNAVIFHGADAYALHAWLLKNSPLIGEDGNAYYILSPGKLHVLKRAADGEIVSGYNAEPLFIDGYLEMHKDAGEHYTRTDNGEVAYVISQSGRNALAVQPK